MKRFILPLALALSVIGSQAGAAEVSLVPGGTIYLNPVNQGRNYQDLMVHTILLSTAEGEQFQVEDLTMEFLSGDRVALAKTIPAGRLVEETMGLGQMVRQGLGVFLNAQVLSEEGLADILGYPPSFGTTAKLDENQFLMLSRQHFSFDFKPDQLRVRARGINQDGAEEVFETSAAVATYDSGIEYRFPLSGAWLMTSLPSVQSHHRFNPATEFAVDFFMVDKAGKTTSGTRLEAEGYFGYGADVMAAAEGDVVFVIDDVEQDRDALTRREGESPKQAGQRIGMYNMQRYATDFQRAAAGNIIVIKHENEGAVEYSAYGHLRTNSVLVQVGDRVQQGQAIAKVGDTGDSAEAHLHFQVNAGPNPFFSKSLPHVFTDLEKVIRGLDPGQFVKKGD